jgi:hypothetical protein
MIATETKVSDLLVEMLTENTGTHMMDSGGVQGRNWQRNKGMTVETYESAPTVTAEVWGGDEILYTISVYHYLKSQLALNDYCDAFNSIPVDDWDSEYYGVSVAGQAYLSDIGFEETHVVNTCNGETSLSQVLQVTFGDIGDEIYALVQIHGGADVRGGYTDARLFLLDSEYAYDGGMLSPEDVYGAVTTDGVEYKVSSQYNGYSLTLDTDEGMGGEFPVNEDSTVELDYYGD